MQVFDSLGDCLVVNGNIINTCYHFASLQFYTVLHDAIFAATTRIGEGHGVFTSLQSCIDEVGRKNIMATTIDGTTIDAGIIDAWLPGGALSTINFDGNRGTCS